MSTSHSPPLPIPSSRSPSDALVEQLAGELVRAWRAGQRIPVEQLLQNHRELLDDPETLLELLSEEVALRLEDGETVQAADLVRRFPRWARQVQALLECHQVLGVPLGAVRFPAVGESLDDFQLLAELGRGAQGRVFLARQVALAERLVVLKCTPRLGQEHLSLARLQHTHVVPLYSLHDLPERGLRVLCLPWFGGATLDRLLPLLAEQPPARRHGRDLVRALEQVQSAAGIPEPPRRPIPRFLGQAAYVDAVCWLGACLADALHYAHERGLVHLDVKPGNVLLSADGQPMLLDFHLARSPLPVSQTPPPWLGGTPGYVAPEQQRALDAVACRQPLTTAVDHRADQYALALLLVELLAGQTPPASAPLGHWLRRRNPQVSAGLADLLARCLAPEPRDRYPDAGEVARDLRRHLADLPLRGVGNRSLMERWRKWRRRQPHTLPLLCLVLAVLTAGAGLLDHVSRQADRARAALQAGETHLARQHHAGALEAFNHGIGLIDELPGQGDLLAQLREGRDRAERARAAEELHDFCERIRPLYATDQESATRLEAVSRQCELLWAKCDLFQRQLGEELDPARQQRVRADLLDLAVLWAQVRVRLSPAAGVRQAHADALELLDQVEGRFGPGCVLDQERRLHRRALNQPGQPASPRLARTAWEHYALGRVALREGDLLAARTHAERALALQPDSLWANYLLGCCVHGEGHYLDAVVAFSACVALSPGSAWCYCNRGLAYRELGQPERALADLDRALQLDPNLAAASLARGLLHFQEKQHAQALVDLESALHSGLDDAAVCYNLGLVHLARADHAQARAFARRALQHDPQHAQARQLLQRLQPR